MCRWRLAESFALWGCWDHVCFLTALRISKSPALLQTLKALNLRTGASGRLSACATAVALHSSARAVGSLLLLSLLLVRPLLQLQLGLFPLVRSQARSGWCSTAARAPRGGRLRNRCHSTAPRAQARRNAWVHASDYPGTPGCPRADGFSCSSSLSLTNSGDPLSAEARLRS